MKKLFKWFFRGFVLAVILLLMLWLAARRVPQKPIRDWAAQRIGANLGRQLVIGPIHLGIHTITIQTLRVSEIPDFNAGTVLTASGIHIALDLRTLWSGFDLKSKFPTRSSGHLQIEELHHPQYGARDVSLRWSLSDMDPTWTHLSGSVALDQGPGLLEIDNLAAASPATKAALAPLAALTELDQSGVVHLGLPNFKHWPIQEIKGRYLFNHGIMDIHTFELSSSDYRVTMTGMVEMAGGKIDADLGLKTSPSVKTGALEIKAHVTGTVSNPKVDLESLKKKAFRASLNQILNNKQSLDVKNQLKNLFR